MLAEVILAMGYGYEVQGRNDRWVDASRKLAQLGSQSILPGAMLVNDLPFCERSPLCWLHFRLTRLALVRYIPGWLPWFSYKPFARYGHDLGQEVIHGLMSFARKSMVRKCLDDQACLNIDYSLDERDCSTVTCPRESARDGETGGSRTRKGRGSGRWDTRIDIRRCVTYPSLCAMPD
jgi:hypothetical protein